MPNQQAFSRILPFAIYILFLAFGGILAPLFSYLAIDIQWLYVITITAVIATLLYFLRNYTELGKRPPMVDFIYAGIAGMVFGALYKTYKNLWVPIFAHAVTNGALGIWVLFSGNWRYW